MQIYMNISLRIVCYNNPVLFYHLLRYPGLQFKMFTRTIIVYYMHKKT